MESKTADPHKIPLIIVATAPTEFELRRIIMAVMLGKTNPSKFISLNRELNMTSKVWITIITSLILIAEMPQGMKVSRTTNDVNGTM